MVRIPFCPNCRSTVRHCLAWSHPFWRSSSSSLQPAQASLRFHKSRSCGHTTSASSRSESISHRLETSSPCSSSCSISSSITEVASGRPPILIKRWSWFSVQHPWSRHVWCKTYLASWKIPPGRLIHWSYKSSTSRVQISMAEGQALPASSSLRILEVASALRAAFLYHACLDPVDHSLEILFSSDRDRGTKPAS